MGEWRSSSTKCCGLIWWNSRRVLQVFIYTHIWIMQLALVCGVGAFECVIIFMGRRDLFTSLLTE